LLRLQWKDVDLRRGQIRVEARHTKTLNERTVPMSSRFRVVLIGLRDAAGGKPDPEARVFGISDNVKRSFQSARREAGLPGVQFRDLRPTFAQRMKQGGLSDVEIQKLLGHTTFTVTYRNYLTADERTLETAAGILDRQAPAHGAAAEAN
jgi:integrase